MVTGLAEVLEMACDRQALLSELELEWARAMPPIELAEYDYFEGRNLIG